MYKKHTQTLDNQELLTRLSAQQAGRQAGWLASPVIQLITTYGTAVLRQFEMMGAFPLNESVAISRSRDKLRSLQLLTRKGVGLPSTVSRMIPMIFGT